MRKTITILVTTLCIIGCNSNTEKNKQKTVNHAFVNELCSKLKTDTFPANSIIKIADINGMPVEKLQCDSQTLAIYKQYSHVAWMLHFIQYKKNEELVKRIELFQSEVGMNVTGKIDSGLVKVLDLIRKIETSNPNIKTTNKPFLLTEFNFHSKYDKSNLKIFCREIDLLQETLSLIIENGKFDNNLTWKENIVKVQKEKGLPETGIPSQQLISKIKGNL